MDFTYTPGSLGFEKRKEGFNEVGLWGWTPRLDSGVEVWKGILFWM
jgi:hypothetical protein